MNYTSETKVREHSGFVGNTNISATRINQYIARATNMVNSRLARVYQLPLPYFWQNTIVFSGAGSGSANMTITVNGQSFVVAITSGLTASAAADKFRRAVLDNADATFQADEIGNGATVTITARAQENTDDDVTPTSTDPQTVSGITATGGTTIPVQHPFIEYLVTEAATAYLLISEYGAESQDSDKDGFKRLGLVKTDLEDLQNKIELLQDFDGVDFPYADVSRIAFMPRDGTEDEDGNTYDRVAKWNKDY